MAGISRLVSKELGLLRQVVPQLACNYFDKFPSYYQMLEDAKSIARRSIIIDHFGSEHIDLRNDNFYNIEHVYSLERETKRGSVKLSLIEFRSKQDAEFIIKRARHNQESLPVPMGIMRYVGPSASSSLDKQNLPFPVETVQLPHKRELSPNSTSYSDLIENNTMSLVNFKMRLITLVNLEKLLCTGVFEAHELMPFGSSVIDLACDSGDLDIVVTRKQDSISNNLSNQNMNGNDPSSSSFDSRLVHLDKNLYSDIGEKHGTSVVMRWFDYILKEYAPLTDGSGVLFVRNAKVPIIKFRSRITGVDCDLSFNCEPNNQGLPEAKLSTASGVVMAQLLYSLCRNNSLFTAVSVYLRIFGKLTQITSKEPNIGMTSFQYLSLVIFYLQQVSIVPDDSQSAGLKLDINHLKTAHSNQLLYHQQLASPLNPIVPPFKYLLRDNFEPQRVNLSPDQIEQLLPEAIMGFLKFYSEFDFRVQNIDLYESRLERKHGKWIVSITNPLDSSQNICHNVNLKSLEHFKRVLRNTFIRLKDTNQNPLNLINSLLLKHQQ